LGLLGNGAARGERSAWLSALANASTVLHKSHSSTQKCRIHIYRLRSKLSGMTGLIETIRNMGYVLRVEERRE
jgi:DNA-binding response OmpR family regulator